MFGKVQVYVFLNVKIRIAELMIMILEPNFADWDDCGGEHRYFYDAQKTHAHYYWKEVKQEIQNL